MNFLYMYVPRSANHVSKEQDLSSYPLVKIVLWGVSVTREVAARPQTASARISNPVSGGRCHLISLTIDQRRLSWYGPV